MRTVLSTDSLPPAAWAAAWQRAVRDHLAPLRVAPVEQASPGGALRARSLGYVRVVSAESGPLRFSRTSRLVGDVPDDAVVLAVQHRGTAALVQDGRSAVLTLGSMVLLDLRRAFVVEQRTAFGVTMCRVPRAALGPPGELTRLVTGAPLAPAPGTAEILGGLVAELTERSGPASPRVRERLAGHLADVLALVVEEAAEDTEPDHARHHLVPTVLRYIDRHLRDPDLTPTRIAEAHSISTRYLHLLFETEDATVSRLIQRRRLEECARELALPCRTPPSVSSLAARWGFQSPSHFSRAFKSVYGHSPRRWWSDGSPPTGPFVRGEGPQPVPLAG
ncbi:helix-turn-helix domain-containing protein [Streptomyces sp. NPDC058955]|uniref:helix-turn-helix domain-containing protein n=1 Tax=unclassified Streptomyces TaxID=2593676 RepID=UPI00365376AC